MACNCDALKAEVMSQRELMTEWFQTLMIEIRDARAKLVELLKSNTFKCGEQQKIVEQPLTGQQASYVEPIPASEFLESTNSPAQYDDVSNSVAQSLKLTRNPEIEQTPEPTFNNDLDLISPKIEPTAEEMSVEFSFPQNEHVDETLGGKAKTASALNRICSVGSANFSGTVRNDQFETVPPKKLFAFATKETRANWISHKRSHTYVKSFGRGLCQKQFNRKHDMTVQMRAHRGEKLLKCDLCDFPCTKMIDLVRHKCHTEQEKLFACDQCSFTAYQNDHLKIHQRIHTGKKRFARNECDFRASQKGHLEIHHGIHTTEKPFACDQCDFCTSQKGHLNEHHRIHTGEKPFACDQCDFRARQKGNLERHERIHTGAKPFQCDLCDYRAACLSNVTSHRKRKHLPQV